MQTLWEKQKEHCAWHHPESAFDGWMNFDKGRHPYPALGLRTPNEAYTEQTEPACLMMPLAPEL
jgi:hypothetical protein